MIEHKCSYKAFVKVIEFVELTSNVKRMILGTPFGHFMDLRKKITLDKALLDDSCGRWVGGANFEFGQQPKR